MLHRRLAGAGCADQVLAAVARVPYSWRWQQFSCRTCDALRLFVLVQDAGLVGKGDRLAAARAALADAEYVSFADFSSVATVLGERLGPLVQGPGEWRRFAPDFVYRYCKVDPTTSSAQLTEALSELTLHVKTWGTLA